MKKCFVGVSGGVDSAVALYLVQKSGYSAEGVTMEVFGKELVPTFTGDDMEDAKKLCERMGVPHHSVDLKEEFKKYVVSDFIESYKNGNTPNPCILCNKHLKFGALADYAFENGGDAYATGHYVCVIPQGDRKVITCPKDKSKDQTYMLWSLSAEQIKRFTAPLGEYTKNQVRQIAEEIGLEVARKGDSQDICFIPDGDYRGFLSRVSDFSEEKGDFIHTSGEIFGKHNGQSCYTIGQRKGLGIAYKEPLYVIGRDFKLNRIILGSEKDLYTNTLRIRNGNFSAMDAPSNDFNCQCKIRYRAQAVECRVIPLGGDEYCIETSEPVRAVTPGQSAVFYDGDTLLGGGIIG